MTDAADIVGRKIIGARIKRTEDPRLLTGVGAYTDDRQVARLLHVAFRRSEHAHARIASIDCAAARAAPGVIAVLTARDFDAVKPLLATSRMKGYYATPIHALARDCFYIGALGSKKTHGRRLERLKAQGMSDAALARIHAPIGLDIGAVSPAEIAVAIMGEITARLRQRSEKALEKAS